MYLGMKKKFKVLYEDLKKINFPLDQIKKFVLFETNRWDLETLDNRTIKLPSENYLKSLKIIKKLKVKKILQNIKYLIIELKTNLF